ncbi:MAG TPA: cupin domain-containing protein [Ktedonobacterales bacterium]|jgi:quercetin dioxygenase-like cupin family protein|nr:cupin domain-containing protein [Ktedonobacterales bacterium]
MQTRRFSSDLKTPVSGNHTGLYAVPIQLDRADLPAMDDAALARRFSGQPILLDRPLAVVALYLDAQGAMEEHSAPVPILLLVTGGSGFVRVGGPAGAARAVAAGDAVLWPAGVDHLLWTSDEPLQAIAIEGPEERGSGG